MTTIYNVVAIDTTVKTYSNISTLVGSIDDLVNASWHSVSNVRVSKAWAPFIIEG